MGAHGPAVLGPLLLAAAAAARSATATALAPCRATQLPFIALPLPFCKRLMPFLAVLHVPRVGGVTSALASGMRRPLKDGWIIMLHTVTSMLGCALAMSTSKACKGMCKGTLR